MRRFGVTLALMAASFALVASTAEAAKTSEKEGRKYSRKYVKQFSGDGIPALGWKIRDCWRIPRGGVGAYRLFPGGVVCMYTSTKDTGYEEIPCYVLGIAVKDGKRHIQAAAVGRGPGDRFLGDPAYCDHGPGAPVPPPPPSWGVTGDPLRPIASAPLLAPNLAKRPPCEKRVDGVLRTIGFSGRTGRLNISCNAAKRIMTRYILHKKLPGQWYCSNLKGAFGKCVDEAELNSPECAGHEQRCVSSFNYMPGQRA